jgi:hypothetical protein
VAAERPENQFDNDVVDHLLGAGYSCVGLVRVAVEPVSGDTLIVDGMFAR